MLKLKSKNEHKRVVIVSDFHSGHLVGLTHPDFDAIPSKTYTARYKLWQRRRRCWDFFNKEIKALQPIDAAIVNGDTIDGKGSKSGGTELLTADRNEQVDMAAAAIEVIGADKTVMSYGTPFHVGVNEDWEDQVAKHSAVNALAIGGHDFADVNGVIFSYKHFVSSSVIPHGRFTSIARDRLWNVLWAERGEYPKADVIIRSHTHYYRYCGGPNWLAVITPALQAYGSKFGTRKPGGKVDFGFVHFDVYENGEIKWKEHIKLFREAKQNIIKI